MTGVSLGQVFTEYLDRTRQLFVPGTYRAWRSYTTDLHRFMVAKQDVNTIDELSVQDLDAYLVMVSDRHLGSSASSKFTYLQNFARTIERLGYTDSVLTEEFSLSDYKIDKNESMRGSDKEGVVKPYLPEEKVRKLWENASEPYRFRNETLIKFMWLTGMRRHEVSRARVSDLQEVSGQDLYQIKVYSSKTQKKTGDGRNVVTIDGEKFVSWTIYFDSSIGTQLETWQNVYRPDYPTASESPYLFVTKKSERMTGNYINELVKRAAENAGLQRVVGTDAMGREHNYVVAHTIRHSFATHIINNPDSDVSATHLMHHMGHNDLSTTQDYIHDDNTPRMKAFDAHTTTV